MVILMMIAYTLPSFANDAWSGSLTNAWSSNVYQNEEPFINDGQDDAMGELDVLMTNDVDPDNGEDGPPPNPLPIGNGLEIILYGMVGYLAYKLKRK